MWVMDTDIALTSFTGRDGTERLRALARDRPAAAQSRVTLLSRGNEPIGKALTGADGRVTFPAGMIRGPRGCQATAVMATDEASRNSRASSSPRRPSDLSDRGIDGRDLRPGRRLLYTERGVYRPGETVS